MITSYDTLAPNGLKCEYFSNPIGLDEPRPRLSWQLGAGPGQHGVVQKAYQVLVAESLEKLHTDQPNVWNSGRVATNQSQQVVYDGPALQSGRRYHWKVRLWTSGGEPGPYSKPAFWEMGLLKPADWQARWISSGLSLAHGNPVPCPLLRRVFDLAGTVRRARVYVAALGHYELFINGGRVGTDYLTPGWTDYSKRVQYQTYDVTNMLQPAGNALGVQLARGWFASRLGWSDRGHPSYGAAPALLLQLLVELEDGSTLTVASDSHFQAATGPLLEAEHYDGETYDARLEQPGWNTTNFDARRWTACVEGLEHIPATPPEFALAALDWAKPARGKAHASHLAVVASPGPRIGRIATVPSVGYSQPKPGVHVYDLGQNLVGWLRLKIPAGLPAGTTFTLRHAEVLNPNGTLYTTNLRRAKCTDTFIVGGGAGGVFEPRFTFKGFRYGELTVRGPDGLEMPGFTPAGDALAAVVVHSDMPPAGTFECSDRLINQLQHNIVWGQKGNFIDVPTDCPQRDERLGWTGDAQVFCRTAAFNFDVAAFFTKWLIDLNDAQAPQGTYPMVAPDVLAKNAGDGGPGWADAGIIVPWTMYWCYGDTRILERHYRNMARYGKWLAAANVDTRHNFGDWLHHDAHTPPDLIATAFAAHSASLLSRIAALLKKKADAARFSTLFRRLQKEFIHRYVTPAGRVLGDTQTAYVLALAFDLLPHKLRPAAAQRLVLDIEKGRYTNTWKNRNWHLSTGFLGVKDLTFVLNDAARTDVAYRLLLAEDYPSWLFPVKNGATTIWERWDGWTPDKGFQDPGMNSFNHYAYGAIGQWLYQRMAGLDMDERAPGYQHALIAPQLPPADSDAARRITWVKAALQTPYGLLASHWKVQGKTVTLEVTVPANAAATVVMPCGNARLVRQADEPLGRTPSIKNIGSAAGTVRCTVGSGVYRFTFPRPA